MSAAVIAVVLLVLVAGVGLTLSFLRWRATRIDWKTLPGSPVRYAVAGGVAIDEAALARACSDAAALLKQYTDFTPTTIVKAMNELHVMVQTVANWQSPAHGGKVAGVAIGFTVYVGRDYAALAHEIAHVCEYLEGTVDGDHASWARRGIQAAVDVFEVTRTRT